MTGNVSRRTFLAAAGASLLAQKAAWAQESTRFRMFWWGSKERADRTLKAAALYQQRNPNIRIDGESLSFTDYWPRLATQTAGRNAPDLIQMDYRYLAEYARRGALMPLDEFMGKSLDISDFDKASLDSCKVDGKLYGINIGNNSNALIYNKAAFQKAGVPEPVDVTWDKFFVLAAAVTKAHNGEYFGSSDASAEEVAFENWLRQRGKALYTAEGQLGFSPEDMTEWFQLWQDLREAGVAVAAEEQALDTGALETNTVTLGHAALSFSNSNQLVAMQALNQDPITITNFPRIATDAPGGHYRKPSMFWSVGGASANKEEAARYVSFFVNNPEAAAILGVERGIPISAAVRDALAPSLDEQSQVALNFVANLGDLLSDIPPPPPANAGEVATALLTKSQEVGFGAQSPQDAGPAFHAEATEILSRAQ